MGLIPISTLLPQLSEKTRSELIQTAAPREPLVGRSGRLIKDVLDSATGQLVAELFRAGTFSGSDAEEEDFHLLIK